MKANLFRIAFLSLILCSGISASGAVKLMRVPEGGLQPQVSVDEQATVHLVYYKGDPAAGDLYYVRRPTGATEFSAPIRVNQEEKSAVAIGTIRGGQIAVGKGNRVHVVWNGHSAPGKHDISPLLYTRLNDAGTGFEKERNLMTRTKALDGGGSVAADGSGNVYVVWHAAKMDAGPSETSRGVFVARSNDDGRTFTPESRVSAEGTGSCACCGMKASVDESGNIYLLYRTARTAMDRDIALLVSRDQGKTFQQTFSHPWKIGQCPMSSAWLQPTGGKAIIAGWETAGQVWFAKVSNSSSATTEITQFSPPDSSKRKHPVAITNAKGETLAVWTEGTGWKKGGALAWQLFDKDSKPTSEKGVRNEGIPVWSFAAAFAEPNGDFVIVH